MKNFIVCDSAGNILRTGSCPDDMLPFQAGSGETVVEGTANDATQMFVNGALTDKPPVVPTLQEVQTGARRAIDGAAGSARARYITIAPGQEATYIAKYQQALSYVAAGYPADTTAYGWIAQESAQTGQTAAQAADNIKAQGDAWANVIGPKIEGLRIGGKAKVNAATTNDQVATIKSTVISALRAA